MKKEFDESAIQKKVTQQELVEENKLLLEMKVMLEDRLKELNTDDGELTPVERAIYCSETRREYNAVLYTLEYNEKKYK